MNNPAAFPFHVLALRGSAVPCHKLDRGARRKAVEGTTMLRRRRQRALLLVWLLAGSWCALDESASAQLLYDERDDDTTYARRVAHDVIDASEAPGRLAVPSAEPEAILEAPAQVPDQIIYEDEYSACDACSDPSCRHCHSFHAGPLGWLHGRFEHMKVQQQATSWLNRPMSFGVFGGNIWADDLIKGQVQQDDGFLGGYYLAEDLTINWGWEMRLALSELDTTYDDVPLITRTNEMVLWDLNFHYYPWENARWRPYFSWGVGVARFDFANSLGKQVRTTAFGMPVGVGMKYLIHRSTAFRLELMDNIAFSSGDVQTQHNVSLVAGLEIRFGGIRRSYWPWNPGQDYGYW